MIWWEDLVALGSEAKCREAGKLAIEGRDYIVRDGDVIHFRFNVWLGEQRLAEGGPVARVPVDRAHLQLGCAVRLAVVVVERVQVR